MVAEIKARPLNGRIDHCQTFNALLVEGWVELRKSRDMTPAKWAMQTSIQPDQNGFLTAKIVNGDLSFEGNRVEYKIGRSLAHL